VPPTFSQLEILMNPLRRPLDAAAAGDPIPFEHDGSLHLFYLSSPTGTRDYPERVRTTWQHAVSDDLQGWRQLPPALEPGPEGSYDAGGIWTGSVVEKDGTFHLFYTAHDPDSQHPQTICVATSNDLVSFERSRVNPLLLPTAGCEDVDWRDPYVFFNETEHTWWMLIAARRAAGPRWSRGCIMLATSPDLVTWTVEEQPLYDPGDTFCPECPELWTLDGRWYLVYSRFSEEVGTVYRVADSPRGPFRMPRGDHLGGRRWYAAKSAPWGSGRAFFGWVHDAVARPDGGRRWLWGGDFALPRLVTAAPDGRLLTRCALPTTGTREVAALDEQECGAVGTYGEVTLGADLPRRLEALASFATEDAAVVGVEVVDDTSESATRVTIDLRRHQVTLTAEPQPLDDFWADLTGRSFQYREVDGPVLDHAALAALPPRHPYTVRLVLDGYVLEVYVNDQVALTHRVGRGDAERLRLFVRDGVAQVSARVVTQI
jgi:beta-fructofuranosidase